MNKQLTDLIKEVKVQGIDNTDEKRICDIQDIIGRSTWEDLAAACKHDRSTVLFILRMIWNVEQLVGFYNEHLDERYTMIENNRDCLRAERDKLRQENEGLKVENIQVNKYTEELIAELDARHNKILDLEEVNGALEYEILQLKSKLYDVLINGKTPL